jgi:dihydrodipicolinate synthase/N-acetylneuraminate lyase
MNMTINWKGVFPALTTPFQKNGELDLPWFKKNLEAQLRAGVQGVVIGGTLGEASVLEDNEKEELVKHALDLVNGRLPVVLNVAEGSLERARNAVREAKEWGVNGVMVLPPMRYKPDHRETVQWFSKIAGASDLPIMIYNNPVDYKTEVTLEMFEELCGVETIQAVKESTRDVANVTRMRNRFGDRFSIMCGVDTLALEELCAGADGWIAGLVCAFPTESVKLYELCMEGRVDEARELYRWFMPLLELDIHPKLVQYIKLASAETGLGTEFVRAPRLVLEGEERKKILSVIRDAINHKIRDHVH